MATWNFARFRYFIKNFDLESFERVIKETRPIFKKLEDKTFENVNFMDHVLKSDIKDLFTSFKNIVEQTGASKLMALKNQNLFIMWDTEIRRMHGIDNRGGADDYMKFLVKMQNDFKHIKWENKKRPLAKVVDEYNYVKAEKRRVKRKNKN